MRQLQYRVVRPKLRKNLAVVKLKGFINAASIQEFESMLDELLLEKRLDVVLDFNQVGYVNSTGISAIVNYHHSWRAKGDDLALIRVHRSVAVVMHQLGLTPIVPILKDEQEALDYLERATSGARVHATFEDWLAKRRGTPGDAAKSPYLLPLARTQPIEIPANLSVLIIEPTPDPFTDVLERRLKKRRAAVRLVHDCVEALRIFDQVNPSVIILRDSVPQADEFLAKIKVERGKSLASVIKVCTPREKELAPPEFKIWENDSFAEPFEIQELFTLTEHELRRVPQDRKIVLHHTRFQFRTTDLNLERAHKLSHDLVHRSGLPEDQAQAMTAAVKEAIDNGVRHGHRSNQKKVVDVTFLLDREKILVTVEDQGEGFDYRFYVDQLRDEDAYVRARKVHESGRRGGLGILLMYRCCDKIEYLGRGNIVRLTKLLRKPSAAAAPTAPAQTKPAAGKRSA
ncbi:MAG: ATP-binding protein [Planctomycetes bacterium]|nr:ATP-binding protein [Planctomycetota bacterium]